MQRDYFLKKKSTDHNSSALRSNSVVDHSVVADEVVEENQSKLLSPGGVSTDRLDASVISATKLEINTGLQSQKSRTGNRTSSLDLLFSSAARITGEQCFLEKILFVLKTLTRILNSTTIEFVIFGKETRHLMLEMIPE